MDDLPELPFEKVLSYLSLKNRLKLRAVSRRWYHQINRFKVKSLCYSEESNEHVEAVRGWASGVFAQNFIASSRFDLFFDTFRETILSNLKHLRICDLNLHLDLENKPAYDRIFNSFGQLEELDIGSLNFYSDSEVRKFEMNLPSLRSIKFECACGIFKLTLDAPRLQKVKFLNGDYLKLDLVHGESVERLLIDDLYRIPVNNLKNLKYLNCNRFSERIDSAFLASLEQLKELHLGDHLELSKLFEQKQRYGRSDLKIYLHGCLLSGPDDPAIDDPRIFFSKPPVHTLAKHHSRLADEIPLCRFLYYKPTSSSPLVGNVAQGLEVNILNRCTDLKELKLAGPLQVQDIQRFLDLLKNSRKVVELWVSHDQPQELFDRLPDHCALLHLTICYCRVQNFEFLFRLKDLVVLELFCSFETELIRKVFERLPFLLTVRFGYINKPIEIRREKKLVVYINWSPTRNCDDLNAAIQFIENLKL